jgi:hypothetical protein
MERKRRLGEKKDDRNLTSEERVWTFREYDFFSPFDYLKSKSKRGKLTVVIFWDENVVGMPKVRECKNLQCVRR